MKYRQYISYSLLAISGIFLLCTVFATNTGLANGLVTGKVLWFHLAMLLLAACSLVAAVLMKPAKPFVFSVADGLVLVLAAIVALTYNRQLDPEPEKMLFGGQLVVLWFLLRFSYSYFSWRWLLRPEGLKPCRECDSYMDSRDLTIPCSS